MLQERVWAKFSQPWGIFYLFPAASWEVYKALLKWVMSVMSTSEAFPVTLTLNKIYTKFWLTETVLGPRVKSSPLETMNPVAPFTIHHKLSVLCCLLLILPLIFPSIRVFSKESAFHIRWPKYWSLSLSISFANEYLELISFMIDWFDFLALQGTLKSILQYQFEGINS